ncbi:hypothetical protein D3C78_912800 [compost metagenome]
MAARITALTGMPVTAEVTNRLRPTGGVIRPISMFTTMMMPRWIGSMPSCTAIGNRIGARIRMIAEGSMKAPATSSTMFTTSRNIHGDRPMSITQAVMVCGICSVVSTWANSMALAMMNISMMLSLPDSRITFGHSRRLMSL